LDLVPRADASLLETIRGNLKEHRYTLIEAMVVRKSAPPFPAEIAVNELNLGGKKRLCFLIRDVSSRKKAQDALEKAVNRLEAHDRARSQFVSNISHELRTPLTSMTYAVSNLLKGVEGELEEPVKRYLEMLYGDTRRMLGTVNDILDLTRIDSDKFSMVAGRVPFGRVVRNTVESLHVQAEQKGVRLEELNLHSGVFVNCDAHKMERVILNIAGNAIKFAGEGGRINISLSDDPEQEGHTLLSIVDNGPGIPPDAISKVTQRHFTVGEQSSGAGLGLAITSEIVQRHGGALRIKSPVTGQERGTAVEVSLPVAEPPAILVVDDSKEAREVLVVQLRKENYRILEAADGEDAIRKIRMEKPDAIVLDLVLPRLQGTEVLLKAKADNETAHIPVLAITGAGINTATAQILRSFAVPTLCKPWREQDLLDKVEKALLGAAALNS
jgi:signal transduction histidine kinase